DRLRARFARGARTTSFLARLRGALRRSNGARRLLFTAAMPCLLAAIALLLAAPAKEPPGPIAPMVSAPRALAEPPAAGADLNQCASCHASLTAGRKPHNP